MDVVKTPLKQLWVTVPAPIRGLIMTMRPKQWPKNGFVFGGILFDKQLLDIEPLARVVLAFFLLCLAAGNIYIVNDLVDVERDKLHPKKRNRPLPSGQLPKSWAITAAAALPFITLGTALAYSPPLAAVLAGYIVLQLAYSFRLKNIVIIDVFAIAAGFVLRLVAGVVVIDVTNFSPWLYVCMGLLSLFLAVGKRRQELLLLAGEAENHRSTYKDYNLPLLDDMLRMVTTGSVLTYTLYTIESQTIRSSGYWMLLTAPIVLYGIFRYLYLIHVRGEGSAPDELLFKDMPLLATVVVYGLVAGTILYVV